MTLVLPLCGRREDLTTIKFSSLPSYLWSADSSDISGYLEHVLPASLVMIEKLFEKHKVGFSDDVLALVDVVFAYIKLSKIYFGADRVRWRVKCFGMKRKYSSQGMHTIFIFASNLHVGLL